MRKINGFTLIELLIAIAIIGLIAAIALPSYNASIQKTRRADALTALTRGAMMEERYYTSNNKFSGSMSDLGGGTSDKGYYTISASIATCSNRCFTLSATPVAGKSQVNDETCWTITIDHTGKQSSKNKAGTTNSSKTCW